MNAMRAFFAKFQKDQRGVTAIEYGLIAIAMAALLTVVFTGDKSIPKRLETAFSTVSHNINQVSTVSGSSATFGDQ